MRKHRKTYRRFLNSLKRKKIRIQPAESAMLNKEAFEKIDCQQCANCCKRMTPVYTFPEISRLADHLGITDLEYSDKYLGKTSNGDIINRKQPCHFLDKNNRCTVYEIRPKSCRGFPYTHQKDFNRRLNTHLQNLDYCPITFHVVQKMQENLAAKAERAS